MRTVPIIVLLNLFAHFLLAQKGDITLIYRLTNAEAEKIYREENLALDSSHFHTLVDTFHTRYYQRELKPAYYLYAKANWEQVAITLVSETKLRVQQIADRRDLTLQVIDSLGQEVTDAQVSLNKRSISYDAKTNSYRIPKRKRGGFLKVRANGETVFYLVENDEIKPYRRRFTHTAVGYLVSSPIRWGKGIYYYFKRGFSWGDWHVNWKRTLNIIPWRLFEKDREIKGYVAFSQPKYRHGDTLQVKAFLTKPNGKPWKKEAQLRIRKSRGGSPVLDTTLSPNHPGNFTFELPLGDSLTLDQYYSASFDHAKSWRYDPLSHRFFLEDYQLDEVAYSIEPEKESFYASDSIILLAEAKDQNGLFVPDVNVNLVVKRGSVREFWADEVRIPDTLWVHEQALKTGNPSRIFFPDSLLPEANFRLEVDALFRNAKGELQEKNVHFDYKRDSAYIDVQEENGEIIARYFFNGEEREKSVYLDMDHSDDEIYVERKVKLPFRERINPHMESYLFYLKDIETEYPINFYETNIQSQCFHTKDSVFVSIQNPKKIPFQYRIGPKGRAVTEGQTDASYFQWAGPAPAGTAYFLEYQYIWGGRSANEMKSIEFYEKLLQIELESPEEVFPGEEVKVSLQVKDARNKPVEEADLTVGAVNAQFNSQAHFTSPDISYKPAQKPRTRNKFELDQAYFKNTTNLEMTADWAQKLDAQNQLFYRLRYHQEGVYMEYDSITGDSFYQHIAQFAPYIIKKGKAEPIFLIYCNRELVYYHGVGDDPPYSFIGKEGYNSLIIRTRDREYTIDSVLLKKGHKLELAIDMERFHSSPMGKHISIRPVTDYFNQQEKLLIEKSTFQLHEPHPGNIQFLWYDSLHIHSFSANNYNFPLRIGPFNQGSKLNYWSPGLLKTSFLFEPMYRYVLMPRREKLYYAPIFPKSFKHSLPNKLPLKASGKSVLSPAYINAPPKGIQIPEKLMWITNLGETPQSSIYRFSIRESRDTTLIAIILISDEGDKHFLHPRVHEVKPLNPGKYQLNLFTHNRLFFQKNIEVNANELLYQNLDTLQWRVDDHQLLRKLFGKKEEPPQLPQPTIKQEPLNSYSPLSYDGPTYLVSGRMLSDEGEPLIGANIMIVGTSTGTISNLDGYYELEIPYSLKNPQLVFSYTGYNSEQVKLKGGPEEIDPQLGAAELLQEVVVTALGVARTKVLGGSLSSISTDALQGRVAGLSIEQDSRFKIRGQSSMSRANATLYFIDGVPVTNIEDLDLEEIEGMEVLKDASAAAIYGANAGQSVVLITTKKPRIAQLGLAATPSSLRSNFQDHAIWQPTLRTDKQGKASFTTRFPDDITSWNAFVIAMDGKKRAGTAFTNIKSYKPLLAQLAVPRFLISGDLTDIVGSTVNYTGDSLQIKTRFELNDRPKAEMDHHIGQSLLEHSRIQAGTDSLELTYRLETEDYFDGEKHSLPVFPIGVEETKGQFWALNQDTSFTFEANPGLGEVQVRAEKTSLDLLKWDLHYLRRYTYECNEQTASRLMALLMLKKIKENQQEDFDHEAQIPKMIKRLHDSQNPDGSWGWWRNNKYNHWITIHVLKALHEAEKAGYPTEALESGRRMLTNQLATISPKNRLQTLNMLSETGQQMEYQKWLEPYDSLKIELSERLMVTKIRQEQELDYSLDSLYHYQEETLFGGLFWEEEGSFWYPQTVQPTLLAYQILKKADKKEEVVRIRQFFLESRGRYSRYGWINTFETAKVLKTILPDMLSEMESADTSALNAKLQLNGKQVEKFPANLKLIPTEKLQVQKSGKAPIFLTAYQTTFNPNPEPKEEIFRIQTSLWQDGLEKTELEAGNKAILKVQLEVKNMAEYLMIEVPIPGACSYFNKQLFHRSPESHREYFKEKTVIFCQTLQKGNYIFEIELEPRFTGSYTINPAKVEQMYFPVFYGRK